MKTACHSKLCHSQNFVHCSKYCNKKILVENERQKKREEAKTIHKCTLNTISFLFKT